MALRGERANVRVRTGTFCMRACAVGNCAQVGFADWADQAVFDTAQQIFWEQMRLYGAGVPECVRKFSAGD